jgi:hypothetical protein
MKFSHSEWSNKGGISTITSQTLIQKTGFFPLKIMVFLIQIESICYMVKGVASKVAHCLKNLRVPHGS